MPVEPSSFVKTFLISCKAKSMPLTHTLMDWPSSKSNLETFVKSPSNFSFSDNATVLLDFIPMMNSPYAKIEKNKGKIYIPLTN